MQGEGTCEVQDASSRDLAAQCTQGHGMQPGHTGPFNVWSQGQAISKDWQLHQGIEDACKQISHACLSKLWRLWHEGPL